MESALIVVIFTFLNLAVLITIIIFLIRTFNINRVYDVQKDIIEPFTSILLKHMQVNRDVFERSFRDHTNRQQTVYIELMQSLMKQNEDTRSTIQDKITNRFDELSKAQIESHREARKSQDERLDRIDDGLNKFTAEFQKARTDLIKQVEASLERIRVTVDDKLQSTLETRLGESFKLVSERLEQVHKGLGEMQSLATGVGDLKKVLTNVKSRGTFGEVQLGAILEQVFTPAQYDTNCAVVPGSNERVEFAIRLPGKDDDESVIYLPIDAKFPQEDYQRLLEAYDSADQTSVESARKALKSRLIGEAKTIRSKYIAPPHTTDFALMFVPTEGLFAEALRIPGITEEMQIKNRVILVGPTNLYAVLNSLQMGFRTLAIQKRSSEVWKVLGAIKTEFGKFGDSLKAVSKKLHEASSKIEATERRTRVMERRLKTVEAVPEKEAKLLLSDVIESENAEDELGD